MADEFEFRSTKSTDPEETYLEFELKNVTVSSYNTGSSTESKPVDEFHAKETAPDFFDDFLF
ncbi:MAG: hypothetical protein KC451_07815 [Amylibacter sp.]|jgi:type VI protein secretion system component Hcp|nr:hypothetical protein [Amylibacter sp.]